jgi:hypothetical protein
MMIRQEKMSWHLLCVALKEIAGMGKVIINNTHGKDGVERASLAFVTANIALTCGQEATVLLMGCRPTAFPR